MSRLVDGAGGVFAGVFTVAQALAALPRLRRRLCTIGGGPKRLSFCSRALRSSCGDRARRPGIAKALGADRHERRAGVEQVARVRARSARRPCPTTGTLHARGDAGHLRQRDGADRRCRTARRCRRPATAGACAPPPGASAIARSVLISDTASAPPSWAAGAQAGTSAVFGVSLTISGLRGAGAHGARRPARAAAGRRRCRARS